MHFLDNTSLLILVRCSRLLRANADTPFAWKHKPPFEIKLVDSHQKFDVARLARSLPRHLPVHLVVGDWGDWWNEDTDIHPPAIRPIRSIQRIEILSNECADDANLRLLLQEHKLQALHTLDLVWQVALNFRSYTTFPALRRLQVATCAYQAPTAHVGIVAALEANPLLQVTCGFG
jgi:hypothetical protein